MKKCLLCLLLAACGFQPMFAEKNTDIYVAPINGINGIELRNHLNAKFGGQHSEDAQYTLKVVLDVPKTQYKALERTGDATWQQISIRASYSLQRDGAVIASGTEQAAESYTFVRYLVASNASYNNAVQNIITVLADKISLRAIAEAAKNQTTDAPKE